FTPDGRLFGIDSPAGLRQLDPCTGIDTLVASAGGNALGGLPAGNDLYHVQGPPLYRTTAAPPWTSTPVGGVLGTTIPPEWCGESAGDLAYHPTEKLFYATLVCGCAGSWLVKISPATGEVVAEVGCIK